MFLCFKENIFLLLRHGHVTLGLFEKGIRPFEILSTMQNHNLLSKQTLDKMLDSHTICPV